MPEYLSLGKASLLDRDVERGKLRTRVSNPPENRIS